MKKTLAFILFFFVLGAGSYTALVYSMEIPQKIVGQSETTFWKYQCVDTMKISRDAARGWGNGPELADHISWEMKTIKSLGANCVAIDTPYDAEFLPYLSAWVKGARAENLHVWFRGNFSGWEGWFDYPQVTSLDVFYTDLHDFITSNPQLFEDGDVFTGIPEAENGGPLKKGGEPNFQDYRQLLIDEYATESAAFQQINKKVELNWQSMSGGYARRMYDQDTIASTGGTVTIDHYVSTSSAMTDYINYFHDTFHAKVNIGEFGAPIPDLNGDMNEATQAAFVGSVFQQFYENRDKINGINYWDLMDGSTALYNNDLTSREAASVVKRYFSPAIIEGNITDDFDQPITNVQVSIDNGNEQTTTDSNGYYSLLSINTAEAVTASNGADVVTQKVTDLTPGKKTAVDIQIQSQNLNLVDQMKLLAYLLKKKAAMGN